MKKVVFVFYLLAVIIISGCASTTMHSYRAGGKETLCAGRGDSLGHIACRKWHGATIRRNPINGNRWHWRR